MMLMTDATFRQTFNHQHKDIKNNNIFISQACCWLYLYDGVIDGKQV